MSKNNYTDELKAEAVKQIMDEGHSVLEVSKAIGVSDASLYSWLKKLAGIQEKLKNYGNLQILRQKI